jgi:hypothetical protein
MLPLFQLPILQSFEELLVDFGLVCKARLL